MSPLTTQTLISCGMVTFTLNVGTSGAPAIAITAPASGEQLTVGSRYSIRWTSTGLSCGTISIFYHSGNGIWQWAAYDQYAVVITGAGGTILAVAPEPCCSGCVCF